MKVNATEAEFEEAEILGKPALFINWRIEKDTVPEGFHCYDIRHADDDLGKPCQLGYGVVVNYFGTLITNEAIQLGPDGRLDITPDALAFPLSYYVTLDEYMQANPPVDNPVFEIIPISSDKTGWLYSDTNRDKERGVIGHLRGDFGNGKQFYTTWWPHLEELNKQPFKSELDAVINWMRKDYGPLKDLYSMSRFCELRAKDSFIDGSCPVYGFQIETPDHQYFLRCNPMRGDYTFYCYCCDKAAQREYAREQQPQVRKSVMEQLKMKPEKPANNNTAPKKGAEREL